jgi:membrane-bound lytic murein transglycosylase B
MMAKGRRRAPGRPKTGGTVVVAAMAVIPVLSGAAVLGLAPQASLPQEAPGVEAGIAVIQPAAGQVPVELVDPNAAIQTGQRASGQVGSILVDPTWLARESVRTGIPERALQAYGAAEIAIRRDTPGCKIAWNTLAAIGWIESGHGSHSGSLLQPDGNTSLPIVGPALDGSDDLAAIPATAATEAATGDPEWDHAVGPLQFIGSTWAKWGVDASGDGVADPNNIDDAALAAGRYLCAGGRDLTTAEGWHNAVHSYNHSDAYIEAVRTAANGFVDGTPPS